MAPFLVKKISQICASAAQRPPRPESLPTYSNAHTHTHTHTHILHVSMHKVAVFQRNSQAVSSKVDEYMRVRVIETYTHTRQRADSNQPPDTIASAEWSAS